MERIISYRGAKTSGRTIYRVTMNGRIQGDSRGYDTAGGARAEALDLVDREQRAAARGGRHAEYVYRPASEAQRGTPPWDQAPGTRGRALPGTR